MSENWKKTGSLGDCTEYKLDVPFYYKGRFYCFLHEHCSETDGNLTYEFSARFPGCEYKNYKIDASSVDNAKSEVIRILSRCCANFLESKEKEINECKELEKLVNNPRLKSRA